MYTGQLISDLMATVDRAEQRAEQQRMDQELHEIYTMQFPLTEGEPAFMGAA
jgi:hypothetical protein